ncbi:MAG: alpha/beta fold hydrolase [Candidatus Eremiobacteraeota bacterium]|nr:alpha/beta fold hydrolase [Candidatus Eremiobacteraeota bacterium]MBV9736637.1 alpha/beta fold hydrolase [Candidatus Eremiobacteraeota bacterium]
MLPLTQAHARLLFDRDEALLVEEGRSIVLSHGERRANAAVLLHGMTASPYQFIEVARGLHASGYNVIVPRLPRHGHRDRLTDVLAALSPVELKSAARSAVEFARGFGDRLTVIGFSLGGLLAAWAAQHYAVDRAVCIAPFLGVAMLPPRFADRLARTALRLPNIFGWWDPIRKARQMPAHGYPRYSTHAVARVQQLAAELMEEARSQAPRAKSVLFVTNAREMTVNNAQVRVLAQAWRRHSCAAIETFEFKDLPFCHDIIEPLRHPDIAARVYPKLLELIDR